MEPVDPERFFGELDRSKRANWKALQLCKQVERAAATVLAGECGEDVLVGASVADVAPAPDASRLRVTVVLASGRTGECVLQAREALLSRAGAFREEVARSIWRKRVPELAFDVRLAEEMAHE